MAFTVQSSPASDVTNPAQGSPQRLLAPTTRDLRARATHRLQVGLFGLLAMLMIVGLANIIMNRARMADRQNPTAIPASSASGEQKSAGDPLADIGVVPGADPSTNPTARSNR